MNNYEKTMKNDEKKKEKTMKTYEKERNNN